MSSKPFKRLGTTFLSPDSILKMWHTVRKYTLPYSAVEADTAIIKIIILTNQIVRTIELPGRNNGIILHISSHSQKCKKKKNGEYIWNWRRRSKTVFKKERVKKQFTCCYLAVGMVTLSTRIIISLVDNLTRTTHLNLNETVNIYHIYLVLYVIYTVLYNKEVVWFRHSCHASESPILWNTNILSNSLLYRTIAVMLGLGTRRHLNDNSSWLPHIVVKMHS